MTDEQCADFTKYENMKCCRILRIMLKSNPDVSIDAITITDAPKYKYVRIHTQIQLRFIITSRVKTLTSILKPFCFVSRREVIIAIRIFIPLDAPLLYRESLKVSFKFIGGRKSYQRCRMTVAQNCMRALLYDIHTQTHTQTHRHTQTHTHRRTHAGAHSHIHSHTRTHTHTHPHTQTPHTHRHIHTSTPTQARTHRQTCAHTQTHTGAHTGTHIHTFTHSYIRTFTHSQN